ncbi:Acyl transferase/acyl hydrolase/lysophospholipase [Penicillium concentricum]|uniref:Acyl transferase/acyl hydrolase/lysophospholipase n=1 Tax=Penicillium concentricum TaxID=293559 RepID=A0A9X0B2C9_9EURO|nr:Acyl transferase/acyl hydrolase/lysophospholipase [Penicillium concentricum]KAJ5385627.1 Acyl transferase/acyl hydrolase/lysophospholipase [Penicillium concentricum]
MRADLNSLGMVFGPAMRGLSSASRGNGTGQALGIFRIPDFRASMPYETMEPHIMHPVSLDACTQLAIVAIGDLINQGAFAEIMLPRSIKEPWLAPQIANEPGAEINCHDVAKIISHNYIHHDVTALSAGATMPEFRIWQYQTVLLERSAYKGHHYQQPWTLVWKPYVNLMEQQETIDYLRQTDLFHFLSRDGLLDRFDAENQSSQRIQELLRAYGDIYGHQAGELKVLEVGAGDGASTRAFLPGLATGRTSRSKIWSSYDLILGVDVVYAVPGASYALQNLKSLLEESGKLILVEIGKMDVLLYPLIFGLNPGWWLTKEESRKAGPPQSAGWWSETLKASGLSEDELSIGDSASTVISERTLMIAGIPGPGGNVKQYSEIQAAPTIVTPSQPSSQVHEIAETLSTSLASPDNRCTIVDTFSVTHHTDLEGKICIIIDIQGSILSCMSNDLMANIQYLHKSCGGILWVRGDDQLDPNAALITGLIRTVGWEQDFRQQNLLTLEICHGHNAQEVIQRLKRIYQHELHQNASPLPKRTTATLKIPGSFNGQQICPDGSRKHTPRVHATGLNFLDVMSAMGEVPTTKLGGEASGIVTPVGPNVKRLRPGQGIAVLSVCTGTFQTLARTVEKAAIAILETMSLQHVAGFPIVYPTVFHCLVQAAQLKKGESILIHAAAGGVGQAALMLANHIGARVFATVSSESKKKILLEYGVHEEDIFYSRDLTFTQMIMQQTNHGGVDVVLNSLAGEALRATFECMAPCGRFIAIGKRDFITNGRLDMAPFLQSVTFAACDLNTILQHDPVRADNLLQGVMELWQLGVFRPTSPFTTFKYSQLEKAFRQFQSSEQSGKVVLTVSDDDVVQALSSLPPPYQFPENAT